MTWRVICGDALQVLPTLAAGSVDACVTDPPYSSGGMVRGDRMMNTRVKYQSSDVINELPTFSGDNRDQRGWSMWCALWLGECLRVAKPGAILCMFSDWRQLPTATDAIQAGGWVWRGIVPWDKVVARPQPGRFRAQCEYIVWGTAGPRDFNFENAEYMDGLLRFTIDKTEDRDHSTQKPTELMCELARVADADGTILDPFAGSGSTGVGAVSTGRNFIGIEIDERYAEIARRRCREAEEAFALYVPPRGESQAEMFTR